MASGAPANGAHPSADPTDLKDYLASVASMYSAPSELYEGLHGSRFRCDLQVTEQQSAHAPVVPSRWPPSRWPPSRWPLDSASTTPRQRFDNASTTPRQRVDNASTARRQRLDNASTTPRQRLDNASTALRQRLDNASTTLRQRDLKNCCLGSMLRCHLYTFRYF